MLIIPNQSSIAKAFLEFDEAGRMNPSAYYDGIVDVMEELVKFTLLSRGASGWLTDRYSERKESAVEFSLRVNQSKLQFSTDFWLFFTANSSHEALFTDVSSY